MRKCATRTHWSGAALQRPSFHFRYRADFSYVVRPTRGRPEWSVDLGEIDFDALALAAGVPDHAEAKLSH